MCAFVENYDCSLAYFMTSCNFDVVQMTPNIEIIFSIEQNNVLKCAIV